MTPTRPPPVLKACLHQSADCKVSLVHYRPNLEQAPHEHAWVQISFLLGGALRETTVAGDAFSHRRSSGIKPGGQRHAVTFGPEGALMLSVETPTGTRIARPACDWRPTDRIGEAMIRQILASDDPAVIADLSRDLIVRADDADANGVRPAPPPWLAQLKTALDEAPTETRIDETARTIGVHRSHLSRAFASAYGVPPSLYRTRSLAMRGVSMALAGPERLAAVAAEAGFADQSHMARTVRGQMGLPVSRIRALLGLATSVQA
jgi:AraC family transcriptional regulator